MEEGHLKFTLEYGDIVKIGDGDYAVTSVVSEAMLPMVVPEILLQRIHGGEPARITITKQYDILAKPLKI